MQVAVHAKEYEMEVLNEEVTTENELFTRMAKNKLQLIEKLGKNRSGYTEFKPDGSVKENFSFHDKGEGSA